MIEFQQKLSQEKPMPEERNIWLIADLHIDKSLHLATVDRLVALRQMADSEDLLIIAGDITDDGSDEQYELAGRMLAPWSGNIVLAPGNHDCGMCGLLWQTACWRRWQKLCGKLGAMIETRTTDMFIVALDSTLHTVWPGDLARGRIGRIQLRKIAGWAKQAKAEDRKLVLVAHHSPLDGERALELVDRGELIRKAQDCGVAMLLVGHEHKKRREIIGGLDVISAAAWKDGAAPMAIHMGTTPR